MKIIVSAGMHRSGSTWLFNVLRNIYSIKKIDFYSCFVPFDQSKFKNVNIFKIHTFNKNLASRAHHVLLTKRDIRDVAASAVRRSLIRPFKKEVEAYVQNVITLEYESWKRYIDLELKYEDFIKNKPEYIAKIAEFIGEKINNKEAAKIYNTVESLTKKIDVFNPVTQLHPRHVTDGGVMTFCRTLGIGVIKMLEEKFGDYCYV